MYKKVKYQNDSVVELLQEASLIQTLAKTAIQSTKYEGMNISENISQNIIDLRTSMNTVLKDLEKLKELYTDIDSKKSEMDKNIKLAERMFLAFQKDEIDKLTTVKKDYETKVTKTQSETKRTEEKAKQEAQQEIMRKERERNKLIADTEHEVNKNIYEAERTKNVNVKQLTVDLEKFKKEALHNKQLKISQFNSSFDTVMKEINDIKAQITRKEDEITKTDEKVKAGRSELKEAENQQKIELKKLKETVFLKESTVNNAKAELEDNIKNEEQAFNTSVVSKEKQISKEIETLENEFAEYKEAEIEKLEKTKATEEDRFSKLKESRATSVADLRAQQKAIMKALESKKDDEVTIADRQAKKAIQDKRIQTDKDIEKLKEDFENYRQNKLRALNDSLSTDLSGLTSKIELIS